MKLIIYLISFQEYDPDLPPELAAATGVHDVPAENANSQKSDVRQSDVMKGSGTGRVRPPLVCICLHICFVKKNYLQDTCVYCNFYPITVIYLVFVCLLCFFFLVDVTLCLYSLLFI